MIQPHEHIEAAERCLLAAERAIERHMDPHAVAAAATAVAHIEMARILREVRG